MAILRKSLGESLAEQGVISIDQLRQAQAEEKRSGCHLREALVKLGFITEKGLVDFISSAMGVLKIELSNYIIDQNIIKIIPSELALKYEVVPLLKIGNRLTCAMADPWNVFALDELKSNTGFVIEPAVVTYTEIKDALKRYYGTDSSLKLVKGIQDLRVKGAVAEASSSKIVDMLFKKAISEGASEIHLEPEHGNLRARFKVDGVLHDADLPIKEFHDVLISKIKSLAGFTNPNARALQEGRFRMKIEPKEFDVRISSLPTVNGENIVLYIKNIDAVLMSLDRLGLAADVLNKYENLISQKQGLVLVSGPLDSGRSTTIYATLTRLNLAHRSIITIEDPVDYIIPGLQQIQVDLESGLTFSVGLRSILKQGPNVIMVSEISGLETARLACQGAISGKLVIGGFFGVDVVSSLERLIEMHCEPYYIAGSLTGIISQKLIRLICHNCKEEYLLDEKELTALGLSDRKDLLGRKLFKPAGCSRCLNSGYKGRAGIFELLIINDEIRRMISSGGAREGIRSYVASSGIVTLREAGIIKALEGLTTLEEAVSRVL